MAALASVSFFDDIIMHHSQAGLLASLFGQLLFYSGGHQTTLSSLQWETSFIGWPYLNRPVQASLMLLNTLFGPICASLFVLDAVKHRKGADFTHLVYPLAVSTGCALACKQLLHHLMIWKIFAPRLCFQILFSLTPFVVTSLVGFHWQLR
jgi:hypothetical protein